MKSDKKSFSSRVLVTGDFLLLPVNIAVSTFLLVTGLFFKKRNSMKFYSRSFQIHLSPIYFNYAKFSRLNNIHFVSQSPVWENLDRGRSSLLQWCLVRTRWKDRKLESLGVLFLTLMALGIGTRFWQERHLQ